MECSCGITYPDDDRIWEEVLIDIKAVTTEKVSSGTPLLWCVSRVL